MKAEYFLPGMDQQQKIFLDKIDVKDFAILVIGTGSEEICKTFLMAGASDIFLIVEDNGSLLNSRIKLTDSKKINVRMMDFDNMDFSNSKFDLVYSQASISNQRRNKIVKEIKRILKPGGIFCVGEIVGLTKTPPQFVKDIWESSNILPMYSEEFTKYYEERNFEILHRHDLSHTLKKFYSMSRNLLAEKSDNLSDQEKNYYKKLLRQISHESNAYLKLGGDSHIGFRMLILKKGQI